MLDDELQHQRHQRESGEERGGGEGSDRIIVVEQKLDLERQRVRSPPDAAGDDGDSAELAHHARIAEQYAIEQRDLYVGKRHAEKGLKTRSPERHRCKLVRVIAAPS